MENGIVVASSYSLYKLLNLNSYHKSIISKFYLSSILFYFMVPQFGISQIAFDKNGEVILNEFYFNSDSLEKAKVKSIGISYYQKKPLQSIIKDSSQSENYVIDRNGLALRKYFYVQNKNENIDSTVELLSYKNKFLTQIKKVNGSDVQIENYVYNKNQLSIVVYAKAINLDTNISNPRLNNYQDQQVDYIDYKILENLDTLVHYKNINQVVYKKVLKEKIDSQTTRISHSFVFEPSKNKTFTYYSDSNLWVKANFHLDSIKNYSYKFTYNEEKKLKSLSKFETEGNTLIDQYQFVYDEKTGLLQAIIRKKENGLILIKKFKYTYYE